MGDAAATLDMGQVISKSVNEKILAISKYIRLYPFTGLIDVIEAYSSLTVIYDPVVIIKELHPEGTVLDWVKERLTEAFDQPPVQENGRHRLIRIPVCYDPGLGTDLPNLAAEKQLSFEEISDIHTSRTYRVYMLGFLPGFVYMGDLDDRLEISRKARPEPVLPGSVGVTGLQTCIYPLQSPGGWYIIGRTPVKLFDKNAEDPVLLRSGDEVQFYPIPISEYNASVSAETDQ